jgi:AraC-like DNA-binding protein
LAEDVLSEILRTVRLRGGVFLDARLSAPWSVVSGLTGEDCRAFMPEATQLCALHYVLGGSLYCEVEDEEIVEVASGELLLLPQNDTHVLASQPGCRSVDAHELIQPATDGGLARIVHGGGGAETHVICGFLGNDDHRSPLMSALPRVLKIGIVEGTSRDWIESSVRYGAEQLCNGALASSAVMSRLSESLFVEAVRAYAERARDSRGGWLAGLGDQHVGRALALIHGRLGEAWTIEALAESVGVSRTVLVERFTAAMGLPPIKYLTQTRMALAKEMLLQRRKTVPQIAVEVGYEAEAAFNRAFKREVGLPPIAWRDAESR